MCACNFVDAQSSNSTSSTVYLGSLVFDIGSFGFIGTVVALIVVFSIVGAIVGHQMAVIHAEDQRPRRARDNVYDDFSPSQNENATKERGFGSSFIAMMENKRQTLMPYISKSAYNGSRQNIMQSQNSINRQ
ncbi:hypothetical protein MIR68_002522 [Amoeboaphelidium protococcarum]|nr:hypothetical protein MIR68_002522 [Amoeboaphelidium protococcarum]